MNSGDPSALLSHSAVTSEVISPETLSVTGFPWTDRHLYTSAAVWTSLHCDIQGHAVPPFRPRLVARTVRWTAAANFAFPHGYCTIGAWSLIPPTRPFGCASST